jgi:hypothetical protein
MADLKTTQRERVRVTLNDSAFAGRALTTIIPPDLIAAAEQRQVEAWIAAGVRLCPWTQTPCDCLHDPPAMRCFP